MSSHPWEHPPLLCNTSCCGDPPPALHCPPLRAGRCAPGGTGSRRMPPPPMSGCTARSSSCTSSCCRARTGGRWPAGRWLAGHCCPLAPPAHSSPPEERALSWCASPNPPSRTFDPEEADFFYVPVYSSCYAWPIFAYADMPFFGAPMGEWAPPACCLLAACLLPACFTICCTCSCLDAGAGLTCLADQASLLLPAPLQAPGSGSWQ